MRIRQICFGLVLALGLPALQASAATLQVFGGPPLGGCSNFVCYSGEPGSGSLVAFIGKDNQNPFISYNASVTNRGLFASFSLMNFSVNQGNLTLRSTDVFTIGTLNTGAPQTVDVTARMRITGQFGATDPQEVFSGSGRVRGILGASQPDLRNVTLDRSGADVTISEDLVQDRIVLSPGISFRPEIDLRVEVGRAFELQSTLSLNLGFQAKTDRATGGANFGNSALISFELPEGYFITSERGYSQGLPVDTVDPADPSVIPLPAGGLLLLSALGFMGWASRRRQRSLTA